MEQEQPITPYPPLTRAPLKVRGVFGIAWQLYKRGFWPMLLLSLVFVTLPSLLTALPQLTALNRTGAWGDLERGLSEFGRLAYGRSFNFGSSLNDVAAVTGSMMLTWLLGLLCTFLLTPMYRGALFLEMNERMEGRAGTTRQLFRYALPAGLRRMYTTFLAEYALSAGVALILGFVLVFAALFYGVFAAASMFGNGMDFWSGMGALDFAPLIVVGVLLALALMCFSVLMAPVYPVAAHEGITAFRAVGRAVKLSWKRFGRMLGCMALLWLIVGAAILVCCLPSMLLWQNTAAASLLTAALTALMMAFVQPYAAAFATALYVDSAAREDAPASQEGPGGESTF